MADHDPLVKCTHQRGVIKKRRTWEGVRGVKTIGRDSHLPPSPLIIYGSAGWQEELRNENIDAFIHMFVVPKF